LCGLFLAAQFLYVSVFLVGYLYMSQDLYFNKINGLISKIDGVNLKSWLNLICLSLLTVIASSVLASAMTDTGGLSWDGTYNTNIKDGGAQGSWASPGTLLVIWGKEVQYNGTLISKTKFFNNSSIEWTEDSNLGNGQIWFTNGDNRSLYWPEGEVNGKVFVGWLQKGSAASSDFRGSLRRYLMRSKRDASEAVQIKLSLVRAAATAKYATPVSVSVRVVWLIVVVNVLFNLLAEAAIMVKYAAMVGVYVQKTPKNATISA
jgi:hypothetical protein